LYSTITNPTEPIIVLSVVVIDSTSSTLSITSCDVSMLVLSRLAIVFSLYIPVLSSNMLPCVGANFKLVPKSNVFVSVLDELNAHLTYANATLSPLYGNINPTDSKYA